MTSTTSDSPEDGERSVEEEVRSILGRYTNLDIESEIASFSSLLSFSANFYRDVAEVYDIITRARNVNRNPVGFDLNDAPILGLLVRVWKIFKETVRYYRAGNGHMVALLSRQMLESAITAQYLLERTPDVVEDYRKCGYRSRIETLERSQAQPAFFQTPPGKRLLSSILKKLAREGFTPDSFETQKRRKWKLQGKPFRAIFESVVNNDQLYGYLYGYLSEAIHGSWNESLDHDLLPNEDDTFCAFPLYQEVDIRAITPLLLMCDAPYRLWIGRAELPASCLTPALDWSKAVNVRLFGAFEELFAETDRGRRENERGAGIE